MGLLRVDSDVVEEEWKRGNITSRRKYFQKIIYCQTRIHLVMKLKQETSAEKVVLGTVTYSLTLVLVMVITVALVFERRFSTAYHWLTTDWREPL